jgi:hypothetical protein
MEGGRGDRGAVSLVHGVFERWMRDVKCSGVDRWGRRGYGVGWAGGVEAEGFKSGAPRQNLVLFGDADAVRLHPLLSIWLVVASLSQRVIL